MKKLFITLLLALFAVLSPAVVVAGTSAVTLSWNANPAADMVTGYKIYYGTATKTYSKVIDVGNVTTYTISGLADGTYYFVATAYNAEGLESAYSTELSVKLNTSPPSAVGGLKVITVKITSSGTNQ